MKKKIYEFDFEQLLITIFRIKKSIRDKSKKKIIVNINVFNV